MDDNLNMLYRLPMPTDARKNRRPHLPRRAWFNVHLAYPNLAYCLRRSRDVADRHDIPCGAAG